MPKALVVDDEKPCALQVAEALVDDGHEVRTATSGSEAIAVGLRWRPDVLITDWMLADDVDGLHVAEVLRLVVPQLAAVLITGFASDDLRVRARDGEVAAFIEKPFDLQHVRRSVREAPCSGGLRMNGPPIAVMEIDAAGQIRFANRWAREMLAETRAGADVRVFGDIFGGEAFDLAAAVRKWQVATPRSSRRVVWHVRTQAMGAQGTRLVVLRREGDPHFITRPLVRMLLGPLPGTGDESSRGDRALIVSCDAVQRRLARAMLAVAGVGGYVVGTMAEANRLLWADRGIGHLVLCADDRSEVSPESVARARAIRRGLSIIGSGAEALRGDLLSAGVDRFLLAPWRSEDLCITLSDRIGECVDCGEVLPLRRADSGEAPTSWTCRSCGSRYRAILDEDCPPDVRNNVRPVV